MKKLLILGANSETIPLVETAKNMMLFTIVADPDPDAPAKKVAHQGINIDGTNVDDLVNFCIKENIDGVLVGVADRLIQPYQKVCQALNLPCYGSTYQCEVLTDKGKFNVLCNQYGLQTIPSTTFYRTDSISKVKNIEYPVFIKPIDRNSGKGITLAFNQQELFDGIEKAFSITSSEFILLEKYMNCNDVIINYTIIDGEPILSAIGDRYTTKEQGKTSQVCLGAVYPSDLEDIYKSNVHHKVVNMLKGIGLENCILTVSAFVENANFYFYDPGFRLQGEAPNLHIEQVANFDQKKFLIDIAMNNNKLKVNNITADFKNHFNSTIWFLLKTGTIGKIEGLQEVEKDPSVFHISKRFSEGDIIDKSFTGTEAQVFARIYISCKSKHELKLKVKQIQNTVKVFDSNNSSQLLNGFVIN